ncbi:MAG: hypothetical protein AAGC79_00710 [Pseudomonadota bacterium]
MSEHSKILPRVMAQLEALPLVAGQPLLAVDADEVLVLLAAHLKRFLATQGIEMRLTEYRLEGTMFPEGAEHPLAFDESLAWLDRFFETEVLRQEAIPHAREVLDRLSDEIQVMVLTNVPQHGREKRIENLKSLGMPYPLVENTGGKGPPLAWIQKQINAPVVFVDDSPSQIQSAAKHAPETTRIHFTGAELVEGLIPNCAEADYSVTDWLACETVIRTRLGLNSN